MSDLANREIKVQFNDSFNTSRPTGDYLEAINHTNVRGIAFMRLFAHSGNDAEVAIDVWLNRGQVQDLMVVLGYWLQETEEKE